MEGKKIGGNYCFLLVEIIVCLFSGQIAWFLMFLSSLLNYCSCHPPSAHVSLSVFDFSTILDSVPTSVSAYTNSSTSHIGTLFCVPELCVFKPNFKSCQIWIVIVNWQEPEPNRLNSGCCYLPKWRQRLRLFRYQLYRFWSILLFAILSSYYRSSGSLFELKSTKESATFWLRIRFGSSS